MLTHDKRPAGAQALSSEKTTDCITVAETSTISQPEEDSGYDSDFWDTPEDKKAKADHYKRVEERGSWLAFLGDLADDFKIVLPLLWPRGNLKVQICLAIQLAKLVADRAWTVLIPLQLGRLTNELMLTAGTGTYTRTQSPYSRRPSCLPP